MVTGQCSPAGTLAESQVAQIIAEGFAAHDLADKRVLVLVPDGTRTAPIPLMFRLLHDHLTACGATFDVLVALGTHQPMDETSLRRLVGITAEEPTGRYAGVQLLNHEWSNPSALTTIGVISADEIAVLTEGRLRQDVAVTLNRRLFDYDLIVICGPTFPHEVIGFSGGNKYFFPGVSGPDVINFTHWVGALITSSVLIGVKDTPVRRVVDHAAALIHCPKLCFSLVVVETPDHQPALAGLYAGTPEAAFSAAADLSAQIHVRWVDRPFRRALAVMPRMYDDLWVGAKGVYKLEPAIADGGELIVYAPHITETSVTHGAALEQVGYHCLEYFTKQWDRFGQVPTAVLAHSTHVRGLGTYDPATGVERPRIRVTLATGIPRERCERLGVGYLDPANVHPADWAEREDEGILLAAKAGEFLYRLR
jgi:nickel-dependent lactate racemase